VAAAAGELFNQPFPFPDRTDISESKAGVGPGKHQVVSDVFAPG
jgi:hypothetical protein